VRALVTGAGGFIGGHVARALLDAGAEVRAFDLRPPEGLGEPVAGDLTDTGAVRRAVDGCDAVFHLAAVYSFARKDHAAMHAVNVEGTRVVLEAAARAGARVVHTSSCATCGPVPGRAATEDDAPPDWELAIPYKGTKVAGERLAREAGAVIVNPTTPVGPGDLRPTPTGKMVADVAHGRARGYLRNGVLNIVAVQDVARGHLLAHERGRPGRRYLLGGENLPMREVFAHVARAAGRRPPRLPVPWTAAYVAARAASVGGREHELLNLDEVRLGRTPMAFDDARARTELGHTSRPAADALAEATRAALMLGA
jgi:dihydroflavonol-4-reductase